MRDIKTYIGEAVAKRKAGKYDKYELLPDKYSIIKWLDANGFKGYNWNGEPDEHIIGSAEGMTYLVGPNKSNHRTPDDWVSVHTPDLYEIVIWFDGNGNIDSIEKRVSDTQGYEIPFDRLRKLLFDSVK